MKLSVLKPYVIPGCISLAVTVLMYYVVSLVASPILQQATLECNKTCWENASAPMPLNGYFSILFLVVVILIFIAGISYFSKDIKENP